ncbi:hypothetical protein BMT55_11600 [Listeria newyorkensis]|uniref:Phage protein n=1 Tax=Listeria newyorkensis TaxID=1497681 RepID=A0ABX4XKG5_9LIST|nr:hypothetical protein [Listeria newyorkensis]PNP90618.1 hypothetical protein BMT55_11600 [Listeria newyorkensis]
MAKGTIQLTTGEELAIDTKIIALTLFKLQHEKVIDGSFLKLLTMTGNQADVDMNLDVFSAMRSVYVAYRQANPVQYISFNVFMEQYEFDYEEVMEIYTAILQKESSSNLAKSFEKKTQATGKPHDFHAMTSTV